MHSHGRSTEPQPSGSHGRLSSCSSLRFADDTDTEPNVDSPDRPSHQTTTKVHVPSSQPSSFQPMTNQHASAPVCQTAPSKPSRSLPFSNSIFRSRKSTPDSTGSQRSLLPSRSNSRASRESRDSPLSESSDAKRPRGATFVDSPIRPSTCEPIVQDTKESVITSTSPTTGATFIVSDHHPFKPLSASQIAAAAISDRPSFINTPVSANAIISSTASRASSSNRSASQTENAICILAEVHAPPPDFSLHTGDVITTQMVTAESSPKRHPLAVASYSSRTAPLSPPVMECSIARCVPADAVSIASSNVTSTTATSTHLRTSFTFDVRNYQVGGGGGAVSYVNLAWDQPKMTEEDTDEEPTGQIAAGKRKRRLVMQLETGSNQRIEQTRCILALRRRARLCKSGRLDVACLLDQAYHGLTRRLLAEAGNWNFNSFTLDTLSGGHSLSAMLMHFFTKYNFICIYKLDITNVWKCFRKLAFYLLLLFFST